MDQNHWKILMVDDDEDDYLLTRQMLSEARKGKYTLDWARSYEDGWDLIHRDHYDAILMDYDLVQQNGLELTSKATRGNSQLPVILYTGRGSYDVDMEAMQAGATLYLTKSETSSLMLERSIRYAIEHKQIEEKLRQSEARYQAILNTLPVGIGIYDTEGRLVESNYLAAQVLGPASRDELPSNSREKNRSFPAGENALLQQMVLSGALNGESFSGQELVLERSDCIPLPVLASVSPVRDSTGTLLGAVVTIVDITERQRLEEELKASERKYRELVRFAPAAIYEVDFSGQCFLSVNDAMCEMLGYSRAELLEMNPSDILDDEGKILFQERIHRWLAGAEPEKNVEYKVKARDGRTIHALLNTTFKKDADGKPLGATVIGIDITERRQAEEVSENHRQLLEAVIQNTPAAINLMRGSDLRIEIVNPAYQAFAPETELAGKTMDEILPEGARGFEDLCRQVLATGQPYHAIDYLYQLRRYRGGPLEPAYFNWSLFRVDLPGEKGWGILNTAWETTERKRAEDAFRESQKNIASLMDTSFEGIWSVDQNGDTSFINQRAAQILGYTVAEIQGRNAFEFLMSEDVEAGHQTMARIAKGESGRVEAHARRKDGSEAWLLVSFSPVLDEKGEFQGALAMFSDITERRQTEEALRESEERFRTMADGTPLIIWVTDAEGQIEFINRSYSQFFGMPKERELFGWQLLVHPEDRAGYIENYLDCLRQQKAFHAETRVRRFDGEWRWAASFGQPRFSSSGKYLGMAGSLVDITDHKQMEKSLEAYTERLKRSNQELETFAFMASHDLQEPLRKIETFSKQLVQIAGPHLDETERDYLERMRSAASRMSKMIDDLLALSRVTSQGLSFEAVDLNKVAKSVLEDLEVRIRHSGGIVELGDLPVIQADKLQIHQLLQNLIGNALKFHRQDIPPEVKVRAKSLAENLVEISVEDNGIGFDMAQVSQLFQPFRRLQGKVDYEGSGIGLSICRRIAERHGGSITAQSRPEEGSVFIVTVPAEQPVRALPGL